MNSVLSLGVVFAVLFAVLVTSPSSVQAAEVQCWVCNSVEEPLCGDDKWTGTASAKVQKLSCGNTLSGQIGTKMGGMGIGINTAVTTCMKTVTELNGKTTSIIRQCGLPAVSEDDCTDKDNKGIEICTCKGDFCNGAGPTATATGLGATLLVGLLTKLAIFG